jgi:endonuclease-3
MRDTDTLRQHALRVHRLLLEHYGEPRLKEQLDPLSELVKTILSQNTADVNSDRAYETLRERYPAWEDVLAADTNDVAEAIRIGGLANVKAPRIQHILQRLHQEQGSLDLGFLDDMPLQEARDYLNALPGVGPKTTACVLLFSLHKPAMPVDTHVHRVTGRIGLIPPKATAEKANVLLEALLPPELYYPFHLNVILHGRTLCKAGRPDCEHCPLVRDCDYARAHERAPEKSG